MSVDAVTGKIIQNRVNDKINYQTSFTDFTTFVEYCRYLKKIGPVASQKVNKVCGKRRSEFTPSWKNDKSDSHAKISLLQYGLIELNEQNYYVVSEIGDRFIALFDDDNNLVADREEFLNVTFDMICIWHQEGNGFDIHPGKMIIRLMLEPELHGYFTDQDLACICNDTDNRLDSQYEEIKEKVIAFRESGVIYTREEKKKTYTLLTGYANNWNIFELDEKSTNEIKIVHLCDDFRQLAIKRLSVMTEDKVPTDDELKTLIRGTDELSKSISDWEVKYGIDGRVLVTHFTRVKQVQDAFRNRLMAYYGRCCMMCGIDEWCQLHDITKASYYWRLRKVREAVLETAKQTQTFVEVPSSAIHPVSETAEYKIAAVIRGRNNLALEITEQASDSFLKTLLGVLSNA